MHHLSLIDAIIFCITSLFTGVLLASTFSWLIKKKVNKVILCFVFVSAFMLYSYGYHNLYNRLYESSLEKSFEAVPESESALEVNEVYEIVAEDQERHLMLLQKVNSYSEVLYTVTSTFAPEDATGLAAVELGSKRALVGLYINGKHWQCGK